MTKHYAVDDELAELRARTGKRPASDRDHDRSGTALMWVLAAVLIGSLAFALAWYVIGG